MAELYNWCRISPPEFAELEVPDDMAVDFVDMLESVDRVVVRGCEDVNMTCPFDAADTFAVGWGAGGSSLRRCTERISLESSLEFGAEGGI